MEINTGFDVYLSKQRNQYRPIYGDIVDRIFNPERLSQFENLDLDPLKVFELLDKVYCEMALFYKLDYCIRIETSSIVFSLDSDSTYIAISEDDCDDSTYIIVSNFYLPKEKINSINSSLNNKSYFRNGYRIIKTLEIICKCWGFAGIKYTHIINPQLGANLRSEGYDNIYKLRGEEEFYDQDYVKKFLSDEEVNKKYPMEFKLKIGQKVKKSIIQFLNKI